MKKFYRISERRYTEFIDRHGATIAFMRPVPGQNDASKLHLVYTPFGSKFAVYAPLYRDTWSPYEYAVSFLEANLWHKARSDITPEEVHINLRRLVQQQLKVVNIYIDDDGSHIQVQLGEVPGNFHVCKIRENGEVHACGDLPSNAICEMVFKYKEVVGIDSH